MARQRSEFLSQLGKLFSLFKKVVDGVLDFGGSDEDICRIDTDESLVKAVARLIKFRSGVTVDFPTEQSWILEFCDQRILAVRSMYGRTRFEVGDRIRVLEHPDVKKGTEGWIVRIKNAVSDHHLIVGFDGYGEKYHEAKPSEVELVGWRWPQCFDLG